MGIMLAAGWWGDFIGWLEGHEASALVLAAFLTFWATVILAVVTAFYAGSAKRQAEASRRMAEETRQQRLIGVQPVVVPCELDVARWYIRAILVNVGSGPSFDLSFCLQSLDRGRQVDQGGGVQVFRPGERQAVEFVPQDVFDERPQLNSGQTIHVFPLGRYEMVVSYYDLYGTRLSAVRPVEVREADTKRGAELQAQLGYIRFSGYGVPLAGRHQ